MDAMDAGSDTNMPANDYYDFHDRAVIAHASLAGIVVFMTVPVAILAMRYRGSPRTKEVHIWCNTATLGLVTIIFALGTAAVAWEGAGTQFTGPGTDVHHQIGLAAFLLVWAQYLGGLLFRRYGQMLNRILHIAGGIALTGVLFATYFSGLDEWGTMSDVRTVTPAAVYLVSWALFLVLVGAYVFGLAWRLPKFVEWQDVEGARPLLEKHAPETAQVANSGGCGC